jgi:cytochrome P450
MDSKSTIKWDPFSPGYFDNPYPHLKDCRLNNPIQKINDNSYFFFKYEDVHKYLNDKNFKVKALSEYLGEKEAYIFKNEVSACPFLSKGTELWPMYLNNDIHKKIRKAITKAFFSLPLDTTILESLEVTLLEYKNKDSFDLVDFCGTFIYHFIKNTLDIDSEDYQRIKSFSNLLARTQDIFIPKQVYQEINSEIIAHKNIFRDKSLFKKIILEETKDLNLNDEQLYSVMLISFMASFESSKDHLSIVLSEILNNHSLTDYILNSDKINLKQIIEETFRFTNTLQYTIRVNTEPLTIGNYHLPANSKLYLCLASANRDEEEFERADELIPERKHNPHLAFGLGYHVCAGAPIARKEMEICLQPMLHFLKDYEVGEVKWTKQIFMRTAKAIQVSRKK